MSERGVWKSGAAYETDFYVFDSASAAVTGLVNGNFTKQLTKDGANSAVTVTVTEVDAVNEPGKYKATYTPSAAGYWSLRVAHATHNPRGWQDDFQAYADDIFAGVVQTADVLTVKKRVESFPVLDLATSPVSVKLVQSGTGTAGAQYLDGTILATLYLRDKDYAAITSSNISTKAVGSQVPS